MDLRREIEEMRSKENDKRGLERSRERREMEEMVLRRCKWMYFDMERKREEEMRWRAGSLLAVVTRSFLTTYQFENLFEKRNTPAAHAVGFWDYRSFITASADYQPDGFGTTGGKQTGMKEVAAFLGHVGSKTSCGYGVATGGPLAWGLCYNKEPLLMNYNYGKTGEALKVDLLNHPEYIEQNATLAFKAAIWRWMTPTKQHQPSAHDVFVGNWKRTKNDTLNKRVPGFGTTMNVLYGDSVCSQGDSDSMNNIISHYLYYLDLMVVGREEAGPHEVLSCGEQVAFNPSSSSS
ncbi:hypothetical protein I3842_01G140000 [Carya illinoinensis]|uniref:Glycoside hydrolase family 19 catalytic domain-containing protein n=1 Tax=Carya illinoinensis TaxID=32201 RepID=A0A922G5I3_CARIL|nr:hypothetical protein I3842_01G140000 [Carya illinoinensis]